MAYGYTHTFFGIFIGQLIRLMFSTKEVGGILNIESDNGMTISKDSTANLLTLSRGGRQGGGSTGE